MFLSSLSLYCVLMLSRFNSLQRFIETKSNVGIMIKEKLIALFLKDTVECYSNYISNEIWRINILIVKEIKIIASSK